MSEVMETSKPEKKLHNAYRMSQLNGWSIAGFGALSLLFCMVIFSVSGLWVSFAVTISGILEIRGGRLLRERQSRAISYLCGSQALLLVALEMYFVQRLWVFDAAGVMAELPVYLQSMLHQTLMHPEMEQWLVTVCYLAVYLSLLFVVLFYQGGMFLFYRSRRKYLERG